MNADYNYNRLHVRSSNALAQVEKMSLPPCPSPRCCNVPTIKVGLLTAHLRSEVDKSRDYEDKAR